MELARIRDIISEQTKICKSHGDNAAHNAQNNTWNNNEVLLVPHGWGVACAYGHSKPAPLFFDALIYERRKREEILLI